MGPFLSPESAGDATICGEHVVVIFDLDGTITDRDTYIAFLLFVLRARPQRLMFCLGLPGVLIGFALGRVRNDTLKCRFLRAIVGGYPRTSIDRLAERFVQSWCKSMVKAAARERIETHRRHGHRLVLATAGLDLYAEKLGAALGFDDVICTRSAWRNDTLSGKLASDNLQGEAKLEAIHAAGLLNTAHIIAYSDHHSDLPLLRFAAAGIAVDPTARLAALAPALGLRIEYWRRRPTAEGR